jgi:hypothetical protein
MECKHEIEELGSCAAIEANLVPMDQDCSTCPYRKEV